MTNQDKICQVIHYNRDIFRGHGIPFYFVLKAGEMFSETKKRLQNRAGFSDKDFAKVKFTIVKKEFDVKPIEDGILILN